ncbi:MAG: hypothetical protein E7637_06755 [Ruminococcaceae bacterium]|nr:hypothetical protein [Oscillospiraceae bacterium]
MNLQTFYRSLAVLLVVILVLSALCTVGGVTLAILKIADPRVSAKETPSTPVDTTPTNVYLEESADAGIDYQDSLIFFGESTTSHLRARGVLSGGTSTKQVWADASGTRMLSSQGLSTPIIYPDTEESLSISQAVSAKKPAVIVLSFGVNGITNFIKNKSTYVNNYNKLIKTVREASPDTKIILQTVYPVRKATGYSVDTETLNQYINTLNSWLPEIAAANQNVRIADTASVLKDSNGLLAQEYDTGDGLHLTADAYRAILNYLRTHAWVNQTS